MKGDIHEHDYEIAGAIVTMTEAMAKRWNEGAWTDEDDEIAQVGIPDRYEQPSSLRDGEVVLGEPRLVEASHRLSMAEARKEGLFNGEGHAANRVR